MFIIRALIKIFYWPVYLIRFRTKKYFTDKGNKTRLNGPVIFVSNYTHKSNTLVFSFKFFFKKLFFWANKESLKGYMKIAPHIDVTKPDFLEKSKKLLSRGKKLFIYTDFVANEEGKIKSINQQIVELAKASGVDIVPIYINQYHGFPHRTRFNIGTRIKANELCSSNDLKPLLNTLKKQMAAYVKYHAYTLIDPYWTVLDYSRIASWAIIPKLPIFFPCKYHYMEGASKKTRAFKGKGIVISNHRTFLDPVMVFMSHMSRRVRIVATDELLKNTHFLAFIIKQAHMLIAHKSEDGNGDVQLVNDAVSILNCNGAIGIFPEGHIYHEEGAQQFNGGVVLMSIMSNSPIYPMYFAREFKPFKLQHIIIGKPIDLSNYYEKGATMNVDLINKLTRVLEEKMKELEIEAKKYA